MDRQESHNTADALQGNINRMFVTKDRDELERMLNYAIRRVVQVYDYNMKRIYDGMKDEAI